MLTCFRPQASGYAHEYVGTVGRYNAGRGTTGKAQSAVQQFWQHIGNWMGGQVKRETALASIQNDLDLITEAETKLDESVCITMHYFVGTLPGCVWAPTPDNADTPREDVLRVARRLKGELEVSLENTRKKNEPYATADEILLQLNKLKDQGPAGRPRGRRPAGADAISAANEAVQGQPTEAQAHEGAANARNAGRADREAPLTNEVSTEVRPFSFSFFRIYIGYSMTPAPAHRSPAHANQRTARALPPLHAAPCTQEGEVSIRRIVNDSSRRQMGDLVLKRGLLSVAHTSVENGAINGSIIAKACASLNTASEMLTHHVTLFATLVQIEVGAKKRFLTTFFFS